MSETGNVTTSEMNYRNMGKYVNDTEAGTREGVGQGEKLGIVLGLVFFYMIVFYFFYPAVGEGIAVLTLMPICYAGWAFGKKGAFISGASVMTINLILLSEMTGYTPQSSFFTSLGQNLIPFGVGIFLGHVRDTSFKINEEMKGKMIMAERLAHSEQRMKVLVENIPASILLVDADTLMISDANESALKFIGMKKNEIVGRHCSDLMGPGESRFLENAGRIGIRNHEFTLQRPHKPDVMVMCSSTPVTLDGNDMIILSFVDISLQKTVVDTLALEKDWMETLLDVVGVMIVALNREGEIAMVNSEACNILGLDEHELVGCNWFDSFIPEHYREEVREIFYDIITSGPMVFEDVEGPIVNADGEERLIKWTNTVMRDESGIITHTISSGEDITEKKRLEEKIRASEKKYRQLFEKANDGLIVRDADGKILDVNEAACEMLGYSKKRLLTMNLRDLHTEKSNRFCFQQRDVPVSRVESQMIRSDGRVIDTEVSTNIIDDEGGVVLGIIRDVTERKKAGAEIRRAGEFSQAVLDNIQDMITIVNIDDFSLAGANQTYLDKFGYERSDIMGKKCFEMTVVTDEPAEGPHAFCPLKKMLETGEMQRAEHAIKTGVGTSYYEITVSPLRGQDGRIVQAIHMIRDITEQKMARTVLEESRQRLKMILENIPAGVVIIDCETRTIVDVNTMAERLIGTNRNNIRGCKCTEIMCPAAEDRCPVLDMGLTVDNSEKALCSLNGDPIPILKTMAPLTLDGRDYLIESFIDISKIKEGEKRLKDTLAVLEDTKSRLESTLEMVAANERRFREMAELLPETIFESDLEGNFIYANKNGLANFGYTPEDLAEGLTAMDLIHPKDHEKIMARMMKIIAGEASGLMEYTARKKDGTTIPVTIHSRVKYDETGDPSGFVGVVLNISKQKAKEKKLEAEATRLELEKQDLEQSLQDLLERAEQAQFAYLPEERASKKKLGSENSVVALFDLVHQDMVYAKLREKMDSNVPLLAIIRQKPEHFIRAVGRKMDVIWLTTNFDEDIVCVSPTDIAKLSMIVTEFYKRVPNGCIIFEGGEYIVSNTDFQKFLHFIQFLNDTVAGTEGTIALLFDLSTLEPKDARALERECFNMVRNSD